MEIDLKQLKELMRALKQFDIQEVELERGEERIHLRRGGSEGVAAPQYAQFPVSIPPLPSHASVPAPDSAATKTPSEAADDPNVAFVTSPFVGTFYRSPSPDASQFVTIGEDVEPGRVLCIVEAMKLMNEIEAEFPCTVLELLVENGKPVEYGDRLFKVRKKS